MAQQSRNGLHAPDCPTEAAASDAAAGGCAAAAVGRAGGGPLKTSAGAHSRYSGTCRNFLYARELRGAMAPTNQDLVVVPSLCFYTAPGPAAAAVHYIVWGLHVRLCQQRCVRPHGSVRLAWGLHVPHVCVYVYVCVCVCMCVCVCVSVRLA